MNASERVEKRRTRRGGVLKGVALAASGFLLGGMLFTALPAMAFDGGTSSGAQAAYGDTTDVVERQSAACSGAGSGSDSAAATCPRFVDENGDGACDLCSEACRTHGRSCLRYRNGNGTCAGRRCAGSRDCAY